MKLTRVDLTELIPSENEGMQICEFLRAVNGRKKLVNYIIKEAMRLNNCKMFNFLLYKVHFMIS